MENVILREFLRVDTGSGYAFGDGSGSGDGSGYASGDGYSDGIKAINGQSVYQIDGVQTIITNVRANLARGYIVNSDLSLSPTHVVKSGNLFAHGATLADARAALRDKLFEDMDEDERIEAFVAEFKPGVVRPVADFYDWHHRLTGSCEQGRKQFARDHGVDMSGSMTPEAFIALTENAYGGKTIRRLRKSYSTECVKVITAPTAALT